MIANFAIASPGDGFRTFRDDAVIVVVVVVVRPSARLQPCVA